MLANIIEMSHVLRINLPPYLKSWLLPEGSSFGIADGKDCPAFSFTFFFPLLASVRGERKVLKHSPTYK